jgi:fucose 4-O-acetylase-like acetyltransferase
VLPVHGKGAPPAPAPSPSPSPASAPAPARQRNCYLDNAKGILIFLVVLGHVIHVVKFGGSAGKNLEPSLFSNIYTVVYLGICTFHMPAFVFIAGYFDKATPDLRQILKTLLIPYLILQIAFTLFLFATQAGTFPIQITKPTHGLWFLLAMVHWRILLLMLAQVKHALPIAILISLLAGCISDIDEFFALSKTFYFFPFYVLGHLIHQKKLPFPLPLPKAKAKGAIILSAVALLGVLFAGSRLFDIQTNKILKFLFSEAPYSAVDWGNLDGILARGLFYGTALVVGGAFFLIVPKTKNFLTRIGQNSFAVYVLHFYAIVSIERYTNWFGDFTGLWRLAFVVVCSLAITWFFSLPIFQNLLSYTRRLPLPSAPPPPKHP